MYKDQHYCHLLSFINSQSFSGGATTKKVDGFRMVQTMAASIEAMMQHKIDAIKVIQSV